MNDLGCVSCQRAADGLEYQLIVHYDSKGYNILEGAPGKNHKFWFLQNNGMI